MGTEVTQSHREPVVWSTEKLVSEEARRLWMIDYGLPHGRVDDPERGSGAGVSWMASTARLNRLARMAAAVGGAPYAVVNVITADEQHQIAAFGVDPSVCSREDSMCAKVFLDEQPAVVPDASQDPRFQDNPFVTGVIGHVRGYVSIPLHAEVPLGSLCVFSPAPTTLSADQLALLENLAENIIDVLELERRDRQLDAALAGATATAERLEDFVRQVSHDLRTPLTSLLGFLELVQDVVQEGEAPEFLHRAEGAGRRTLSSLRDLLDQAVDGSHLERATVDLPALVARVEDDVADLITRTGATLECPGGSVLGDESHLHSLVQNLVVNSIKYCPAGRTPRVRITAVDDAELSGILVEDNGRGIPAEDRDQLLRTGGRLRRSGEPHGTGLGLGICRHIAQAHGGHLSLVSTPLGGIGVRASWPTNAPQ
ncbi:GAF domain-containing sensor histidine kinase [uncultured Brachybacterium sp.]|uniref:GAF domain-containing sensor histidine kinase n=1 Tax=uncultured Brachybacterium sp. TaxID=189680 RepID=UPI0026178BA0|nr:GAF domain-containing sensor histidine kinase [uncultured Brachybacterium sp.]